MIYTFQPLLQLLPTSRIQIMYVILSVSTFFNSQKCKIRGTNSIMIFQMVSAACEVKLITQFALKYFLVVFHRIVCLADILVTVSYIQFLICSSFSYRLQRPAFDIVTYAYCYSIMSLFQSIILIQSLVHTLRQLLINKKWKVFITKCSI